MYSWFLPLLKKFPHVCYDHLSYISICIHIKESNAFCNIAINCFSFNTDNLWYPQTYLIDNGLVAIQHKLVNFWRIFRIPIHCNYFNDIQIEVLYCISLNHLLCIYSWWFFHLLLPPMMSIYKSLNTFVILTNSSSD